MAIHREGGMAHHSGTIVVERSYWHKWFSLFGKVDMHGKKIRGFIYRNHSQVWDCGHTINTYYYVTQKDMFKLKLKGRA